MKHFQSPDVQQRRDDAATIIREQANRVAAGVQQLTMSAQLPDMQRTDDGWRLVYQDTGATMDFTTYEDAAFNDARARADAKAIDQETQDATTLILGESAVEFREGVYTGVARLYSGFDATTVVQETLEADARRLLREGKREWLTRAVRDLEQRTGDQWLPRDPAQVTDLALIEAFSHIGEAVFVGESVRGHQQLRQNQRWLRVLQNSLLGRVMEAVRAKFAAMFDRAEKLMAMRDAGQLDANLDLELSRALGLEQIQHDRAVLEDARALRDDTARIDDPMAWDDVDLPAYREPTPEQQAAGEAFSLARDDGTRHHGGDEGSAGQLTPAQRRRFQEKLPAVQEAFRVAGRDRSLSQAHRENILRSYRPVGVGEVLLVDQGLKPLYHEAFMFQESEAKALVADLRKALPHLEAETWGQHVVVWNRAAVEQVIAKDPGHYGTDARQAVRQVAESDVIGELLGNGPRTVLEGDTTVRFAIDGQPIIGGFVAHRADAARIGEQRREAFEMSFGEPVTMQVRERGQRSFSLLPGELDARLARMFDPFQRSPELRRQLRLEMLRRIARAKGDWEQLAMDNRTVTSINREARTREAFAADRIEGEMIDDRLTPADHQALALENEASFRDSPVVRSILEELGPLMSRTEALRSGRVMSDGLRAGDYDGVPQLPSYLYGGRVMPDQAAQMLFDRGMIKDPTVDALWDALATAQRSSRNLLEAAKVAREKLRDIRRTARHEAKAEAERWKAQALHKARGKGPERQRLVRAMRTLDAILSAPIRAHLSAAPLKLDLELLDADGVGNHPPTGGLPRDRQRWRGGRSRGCLCQSPGAIGCAVIKGV